MGISDSSSLQRRAVFFSGEGLENRCSDRTKNLTKGYMDFEIAIPSYQRAKRLKEQTLSYLLSQGVPKEKITIFVKNQEEYERYTQEISGVSIIICLNKTLNDKRTFINYFYPEGTRVVNMDDDIKELSFLNPTRQMIPTFNRLFQMLEEQGCSLWGVYPVYTTNKFYLKERVAVGLNYCVGACFGYINRRLTVSDKCVGYEDKWTSLYYYKRDGKVLRYEGCCPKTNYFSTGGLAEIRKQIDVVPDLQELAKEYPDCVQFKVKANGRPDLVFKRTKRVFLGLDNQSSPNPDEE